MYTTTEEFLFHLISSRLCICKRTSNLAQRNNNNKNLVKEGRKNQGRGFGGRLVLSSFF